MKGNNAGELSREDRVRDPSRNLREQKKKKWREEPRFDIITSTTAIRESINGRVSSHPVSQNTREADAEGYQVLGQSRLHGEKEGKKGKRGWKKEEEEGRGGESKGGERSEAERKGRRGGGEKR